MLTEYDDLLTTEEACTALKIGYNYLYQLLNTGKLKAYRCGRYLENSQNSHRKLYSGKTSFFLILPCCNTECMNVFLEHLSASYPDDMIVLVCDGAAWHKSGGAKKFCKFCKY